MKWSSWFALVVIGLVLPAKRAHKAPEKVPVTLASHELQKPFYLAHPYFTRPVPCPVDAPPDTPKDRCLETLTFNAKHAMLVREPGDTLFLKGKYEQHDNAFTLDLSGGVTGGSFSMVLVYSEKDDTMIDPEMDLIFHASPLPSPSR